MYSNGENTKWFSQSLLAHKDKFYGTDGYLQISISTNTEDFKFFNPPLFNISISNNYRKSYNLNYHHACDLLRTLELVKQHSNGEKSEIQRKYQKNMMLYIQFFVESNNHDSVVDIRLLSNETDFVKVIIPISMFATLAKCLRYYVDNYFNICTQLLGQTIQSEAMQIIHQLPSLIKGISSQIVAQETFLDSREPEPEPEAVSQVQATINDLDNFIGGEDMKNIDIPELMEDRDEKKPIAEVDSIFTRFLLKNDLTTLETMLHNHSLTVNPLMSFTDEIVERLGPDIKGDFSIMPGINEDDKKSLCYMSKLYFTLSYYSHFTNDTPIPSSMPIFKYNPRDVKNINMEIAYDLLLFNLYIRAVRNRLEGKLTDWMRNKAMFHIQLRCFTDPLVFSFIGEKEGSNLSSLITARYKYYDSIGVFDSYKKLLEEVKCPEIKEHDISSATTEAVERVIGKTMYIDQLHKATFDSGALRLPSKNKFSLEQIINEVIPLELAEKLGRDIKKQEIQDEISSKYPLSDEILTFFIKGKRKPKVTQQANTFSSNLERVVNFYSDEVPSQYKDSFTEYIKTFKDSKFNMETDKFPLDEFGDNIVRALYLWDPKDDPQITKSYKHYQLKIENELMEKDLIIAKIKSGNIKETETNEWDFLSQ